MIGAQANFLHDSDATALTRPRQAQRNLSHPLCSHAHQAPSRPGCHPPRSQEDSSAALVPRTRTRAESEAGQDLPPRGAQAHSRSKGCQNCLYRIVHLYVKSGGGTEYSYLSVMLKNTKDKKKHSYTKTHHFRFITELFITSQTWKHHECPSTGEWAH